MSPDAIFALIQLPLAGLTAIIYGRQYRLHGPVPCVRYRRREWLRSQVWLAIAAVSCGMVAWRLGTISDVVEPDYRAAGGMAVQTLYQLVVLIAYVALRDHPGHQK